jgi:D-3-phosphoglycerate dehydrogenase
MVKVLISDKMSPLAEQTFKTRGVDVDYKPGLSPAELSEIIGDYDGLAIRSSTTVTRELLDSAHNLKVIGRAGIGVDNIDRQAATERGIVVMNTPFGNSITTAEHAIAMMFALARQIPQANESTHQGKWEKSGFMGQELYRKTLGIIGCGNIGAIVADRALGVKMKVIAYDPYLNDERAQELGVEKADLDEVLKRADYITLHTPLTDKTRGIIGADNIAKMKKGVRIINCARGGLIDEPALKEALDSGQVAGAALDVFEKEPATDNILFGHKNVVCTPHLGASTEEAQENVALQVAEQISDYLLDGAVTNALNMPSVTAEDAPKLKPYMQLAENLGSFVGQIARSAVKKVEITYEGHVTTLNTKPLKSLIISGMLRPSLEGVNIVSAPVQAAERGIEITESFKDSIEDFQTLIRVKITTEKSIHNVDGTLFGHREPRIINIDTVPIESELTPHMLFVRNFDQPGLIGGLGTVLGNAGINIGSFRLGRIANERKAIALVSVDDAVNDNIIKQIEELSQIDRVQMLSF